MHQPHEVVGEENERPAAPLRLLAVVEAIFGWEGGEEKSAPYYG